MAGAGRTQTGGSLAGQMRPDEAIMRHLEQWHKASHALVEAVLGPLRSCIGLSLMANIQRLCPKTRQKVAKWTAAGHFFSSLMK